MTANPSLRFTYKPTPTMQRMMEADDILEREEIKGRIYGCRPQTGEKYRGITYDNDGIRWITTTSTVTQMYPLSWAVGMEAERGHVAQWILIRTASNSLYAVAEIK
jgi:hypothetical protein